MKIAKILAAASLAFCSMTASAGILYQNLANNTGGNNPFDYNTTLGAENFSLSNASTITAISFNAFHSPSATNPSSIDWSIRANNGTKPGAVIASGNGSSYTNIFTSNVSIYKLQDYVLDIPDLTVTAGTYWVTFHVNATAGDPHWSFSSTGDGISAISYDNGANWANNYPGGNMAFRIEGAAATVPEPTTVALLGLGLLGVAASRRKSAKSKNV